MLLLEKPHDGLLLSSVCSSIVIAGLAFGSADQLLAGQETAGLLSSQTVTFPSQSFLDAGILTVSERALRLVQFPTH